MTFGIWCPSWNGRMARFQEDPQHLVYNIMGAKEDVKKLALMLRPKFLLVRKKCVKMGESHQVMLDEQG